MKFVSITTIFMFIVLGDTLYAQISGPNPTYAGSTQQYTWSGGQLINPNWQIGNGTKVSQAGNSVTVTWSSTATSGAVVLIDNGVHKGTFSVTLMPVPSIPPAPVISSATSITPTSFTANWASSPGATSYRLDVSTSSSFSTFVSGYNNLLVNGTSQVVTGLTVGGTYYYRVRAVGSAGTSPNSTTSAPVLVILLPPANITAIPQLNSINLSWGSVSGVTGYIIDVATDANFNNKLPGYNSLSVTGTSRVISGLIQSTNYWIRLRSYYGTAYSAFSSTIQTTTSAPPEIVGPSVIHGGSTQQYYWTGSQTNLNWVVGNGTIVSQSGNSVTVTWNSDGEGGAVVLTIGGVHMGTLSVYFIPAVPTSLHATSIAGSSFIANWGSSQLASSYQLDVSTSPTFDSFVNGYNNLLVSGTSHLVSGLSSGSTYYFRVRAVNSYAVSENSASSAAVEVYLGPPANLTGTPHSHSISLSWAAAAGAIGYYLDAATDQNFTNSVPGYIGSMIQGTSVVVQGLRPNQTYWFRVRSFEEGLYSSYSPALQTQTLDQFNSVNENFIVENVVLVPGVKDPTAINTLKREEVSQAVRYFDGLGRIIQSVTTEGSPSGLDIVQPFAYDAYGRESVKFLPYVDASKAFGQYKTNALIGEDEDASSDLDKYRSGNQFAFYQRGGSLASDLFPYAVTKYDNSPLNRTVEQGFPGAVWQPDNVDSYLSNTDRTVKFDYEFNAAEEVVLWTYSDFNGVVNVGEGSALEYYEANQLFKTKTKDENFNEVHEYKDKDGKVILKKVQASETEWAQTYYIYDDYGNLVMVLPPEAVKALIEQ